MLSGQVIIGAASSIKVTVNEQFALFPLPSVAVKVTVSESLCPLKTVLEAGLWVTVGLEAQLSLNETGP